MEVQENIHLAPWATFQTGGPAQFMVEVETEAALAEAVAYARARNLPLTLLGGGSNVLVSDAGLAGLVVVMRIKGVEATAVGDTVFLTVGAGEVFDAVVAETVAQGYWGLENLSHIPGSVGATPVQNVGAYGVEVGSLISLVRVFDTTTETFTSLSMTDCRFGYRDSVFKQAAGKRYIVTAVTFALSLAPRPQLQYRDLVERFEGAAPTQVEIRDAIIDIRSQKFPDWHTVGTAGSFFKNPIIPRAQYEQLVLRYPELPMYVVTDEFVKVPLGWILDKLLQLKGQGTETVGCYAAQALVVINKGGATTADIVAFTDDVIKKVHAATGITVEREVTVLGA